MTDGTIVENGVNRAGLRILHAICSSKPDPSEWIAQCLPMSSVGEMTMSLEEEKGLGMWHLRLFWPAREVVDMGTDGKRVPGVMWRLADGERVSEGLESAGNIYIANFSCSPRVGLVGKGTLKQLPGELVVTDEAGEYRMELREADWLDKGVVLVWSE